MTDISIRKTGHAGHITLNRHKALNALTWDMCLAIEQALDDWRDDPDVALILIDGAGDRAFCSGGDIAEMYAAGQRGDLDYGRRFWRDEYRLNAKLYNYTKPIVTFLHGFTMGGGVGVGCHASHRIVCETSQIAMPECSIGLVPDVGGSLILAKASGHCGEFLGVSGDRMDAADAIYVGFADHYVPQDAWDELKATLIKTGDLKAIESTERAAPAARLADWQDEIDACFGGANLGDIYRAMPDTPGPAMTHARKLMDRNAPLAMAVAVKTIQAARHDPHIENALDREFRYTYRCVAQGDFIEGIRAAIIDRDRNPKWQHSSWDAVTAEDVAAMTRDLGKDALQWKDKA
ncbi:enoyl-CoA hydratase/isomerase family protein [Roseobacter sp. CCS2]|uniref:enoyl-CoA hydratase/isomerase family protein n=1 Tax=Roseobacter sp. CCS2 TaxID=391593 RepID=UPI0000F3C4BA|nr:enoyl-CoA hydratase/isomerase family protein [Roseobacter sp. CCS2]EBA11670.1 Enoyl-CoA hydratase/isomerase [Roseobacter sp. CCS2]